MLRRYSLYLLLLIGLLITVFHDPVLEWLEAIFRPADARPVIASIEEVKGQVNFKLPQTLIYKSAKSGLKLRHLDTVITDQASTAIIKFESGFRVELAPNSIIVIEKPSVGEDGQIRVTFLRGDLRILDQGSSGKLILNKGNILQDASGRAAPEPIKVTVAPPAEQAIKEEVIEEAAPVIVKPTPRPTPPKKRETLPDDYIAQMVRKQTPFFNRCYAEHLRFNPNARGRVSLSFTISSNGQVASVRLLGSTLKDTRLEQCTMSVIERIRFRKFEGDPILVNYPINFE